MPAKIDLTGQTFSKLTVIRDSGKRRHRRVIWECQCSCGNITNVSTKNLTDKNFKTKTKSCGCFRIKHGASIRNNITPLYRRWQGMKKRCNNSNSSNYKYYGGRGIKVCVDWENDFIKFRDWAEANGFKKELQIDRRDNELGYSPENCRWVTQSVNQMNKRNNNQTGENPYL